MDNEDNPLSMDDEGRMMILEVELELGNKGMILTKLSTPTPRTK
jgi:hypothetical protein